MAKALGVPKATYDNWERGRANPSRSARAKLIADLARIESGDNLLNIPLPADKARLLESRAAREGKTPEELAAELLKAILGLIVFLAVVGAALLAFSVPASAPEQSSNDIFWSDY